MAITKAKKQDILAKLDGIIGAGCDTCPARNALALIHLANRARDSDDVMGEKG